MKYIKEHKYNLTKSQLEKSKLVQHVHDKWPQKICWKEVNILYIEPNTTYRKYKEYTDMHLMDHPIIQ
jgi:hypothetical protein